MDSRRPSARDFFPPIICSWITPSPPDPRWEALPVRMAMVEVERALEHLASATEAGAASDASGAGEEHGLFTYRLAVVRRRRVVI